MTLDLEKIDLGSFGVNELEQQQNNNLKSTMGEAMKVNPDQHAKTMQLSRESGVPEFALETGAEDVERQLKLDGIDFGKLPDTPVTSQFISDYNNAIVVQDDIDMMTMLENTVKSLRNAVPLVDTISEIRPSKVFQGQGEIFGLNFKEQARGGELAAIEAGPKSISDLVPMSALPMGMEFDAIDMSHQVAENLGIESDEQLQELQQEQVGNLLGEIREIAARKKELTPDDLSTMEQGIRAGIESLGQMAPGFTAMIATGGRASPLLISMGAQTFTGSYADARAEGLEVDQARYKATIDAAIEVGTELLPAGTLSRMLTRGARDDLTKGAIKFAVQEMGTEQLATLGQSINDFMFGLDEQMEEAETIEEMVQIQLQRQAVTAIATVVAGGTQIATVGIVRKSVESLTQTEQQKQTQSEVEQDSIDRIDRAATDSKLRERDKESFRTFMQEAGEDTNVFITATEVRDYLQQKTAEEISEDPALRAMAEQVQEAANLDGDVVVPVSDFATDFAGTDHFTTLRQHMRMSEDTSTPVQQEAEQQATQDYMGNLIAEAEQNVSEYIEAQEIFNTVKDQLIDTGRMSAKDASVAAQLVPSWATVHAQKNGITVQEAYQQSGLQIAGPFTGEAERLAAEAELLTQARDVDLTALGEFKALPDDQQFERFEEREEILDRLIDTRLADDQFTGMQLPSDTGVVTITPSAKESGKWQVTHFSKDGQPLSDDGIQSKEEALRGFFDAARPDLETDLLAQEVPVEQRDPEELNGVRGFYDPANSIIRLTEASDLSTFLHEFAHFMLEMERKSGGDTIDSINNWYKRNAKDVVKEASKTPEGGKLTTDVSEQDVTDFLDFGTTGDATRDQAINRAVHEQFARGFETYLMEGKAPSIELRNAFRTFARWLSQIYNTIKGDLRVNLDNEMRQVFDRMVATEEQIAAAEARAKFEPMFTDASMAGMTEKEFQDYEKRQSKVKDVQSETLRDKLIKEYTGQQKKWWKEEKQDLIVVETERLQGERVYATRQQLRDGDVKLDRAVVKEMTGEEKTDKLGRTTTRIPGKLSGMTAPSSDGLHPDQAAALFGYSSGDEMIQDLIDAPPLKEVAEANAEASMKEIHGDIMNDGSIERLADEAVLNEERGKLLLRELKVLTRGTNQRALDRQAIKDLASENIGKLSFRNIHPGKYRKAEIKAAQESARMLAEGNRDGAAAAKTRQVVNYYLGMEATNAKTEAMKIVDRMSRYNKKSVKEEIQKAEGGYWDQIVKILERFEFRKSVSLRQVDRVNQDINSWMRERIDNDGDGLVLTDAVLNESYITHWKNVPFADLQGINDSVKNIEHVARYANKIRGLEQEIEFKKLVQKWVDSMNEKVKTRFKTQRTDVTEGRNFGRWAMSQMTKIPFMASWLDGGERVGLSHDLLVQPLTDAYDAEVKMWGEVGNPVMEAIMNRSKDDMKRHNSKIFIPEIQDANNDGNLMGHQILSVALNTGNDGNLRKMLLGEGWADPDDTTTVTFENPRLQAVLQHMTKDDWKMVQMIWDQMEKLYPQLAEVHRRTTGLTPPKVERSPRAVTVNGEEIELEGGYYPVKYDPNRDARAAENEDRLNAETESMFSNLSLQAQVNAGATNERTGYYAPIRLSLDVVPNHLQETIHYITHHDPVRQINRLIRNKSVRDTISEKLGKEEFAQLKPWLNDVAKDGREAPLKTFWGAALQRLRFGTTLGVMGFKASTGIIQISGLSNSIAELGIGPVYQGLRSVLGTPDTMKTAWEFAVSNSKVMAHRADTMDREIKNAMQKLEGKRGFLAATQEASMKHIALIQTYMVDLPTWHAAYIKAMNEHGDEKRAYQHADWVVENVQGSGVTKDMAQIMRNQSQEARMFTMFMTFFSSLWNLERDLVKGAKTGFYSKTTVAAKMMFLFTVPVLFEMMMRGDLGEPEDEDERLQQMLTNMALFPVQSVPFVRDVATGAIGDYGYNISPIAQLLDTGTRTIPEVGERIFTDEDITKGQVKGATKFIGATVGVPGINQAWATGEHLYDVIEEGEEFTVHQLLFGPKRD